MRRAKNSIVVILAFGVLICIGCRKKQQQGETPSETETTQTAESNAVQPAQTTQLLKERPKVTPPREPNAAGIIEEAIPMNLEQFASLSGSDEKIDWIYEFADAHPEQITAMAVIALDDKDVEVRSAAMETLIDNEVPDALAVITKAMKDKEEEIRQQAAEACEFIDDKQAGPVLVGALADESEMVREAALQVAELKSNDAKISVYKAAIASKYEDVKQAAVPALVDMSSPKAVDILLEGLKDPDPEFRQDVIQLLDLLIGQEFESYQQGKKWWDANRKRFDEDLVEQEEPQEQEK
jgi:hypothetical protein